MKPQTDPAITQVVVVDDHPFFRSGLIDWLNRQPGFNCCGQAASYQDAREVITALQPDIVLMDLQLPDGDGLDLIAELTPTYPQVRFIALSQRDEGIYAHRALKAGARGYIMKSEATEIVLEALRKVLSGDVYLSRPVAARLLQNLFPDPQANQTELSLLSDRELQVFQLIGSGCKNREVAEALKISSKTVETYRENLKDKLRLTDSEALRRVAEHWVETGRFHPNPPGKVT